MTIFSYKAGDDILAIRMDLVVTICTENSP